MIKTDKVLHFVACFCIVAVVALLCYGVFEFSKAISILVALGTSLLAAVGKEGYDFYIRKTGFDKQDLMADAIGAVLASLFALGM